MLQQRRPRYHQLFGLAADIVGEVGDELEEGVAVRHGQHLFDWLPDLQQNLVSVVVIRLNRARLGVVGRRRRSQMGVVGLDELLDGEVG